VDLKFAFVNGQRAVPRQPDGTNAKLLAICQTQGGGHDGLPTGKWLRLTLTNGATSSMWRVRGGWRPPSPFTTRLEPTSGGVLRVWTPDGNYFVFQSGRSGKTEIWALRERRGLLDRLHGVRLSHAGHCRPDELRVSGPLAPTVRRLYVVGEELRGSYSTSISVHAVCSVLRRVSGEMADFSHDGQWIRMWLPERNLWRSRVDGTERLQTDFPPVITRVPRGRPTARACGTRRKCRPAPRAFTIPAEGGRMEPVSPEQFIS